MHGILRVQIQFLRNLLMRFGIFQLRENSQLNRRKQNFGVHRGIDRIEQFLHFRIHLEIRIHKIPPSFHFGKPLQEKALPYCYKKKFL
ncbi:hypothetical protein SDC9_169251 [bioreactor metagenome]|uniref:Uncharacterized protein n=1 Tax=bioreactor metagenome TaxID=1076179 RepID=A0A645G7V2_9ZZZZ